jgi:DNA helicase-2/ATP-dependent DNA helicase PcrA
VGRKVKKLWTDKPDGELVQLKKVANEREEAELIANEILGGTHEDGFQFSDYALLYRTNAQSRSLEEGLVRHNVPYKIVGGTSFYQRKEIKDILSYLKTINNQVDDLAVKRIINVPKRGIGQTSVGKVEGLAEKCDINFYDALKRSGEVLSSSAVGKITGFVTLIQKYKGKIGNMSLVQLTDELLVDLGYRKELELENTTESLGRLENIDELISKLTEYEMMTEEPNLGGFLEEVALIADIDQYQEDSNYVVLMTLHSAKGLEFPCVFITGMEDGLFPSYMSLSSGDEEDIEEERRLCYVGITRAETKLYITYAAQRMVRGLTQYNPLSRYVKEIPSNLIESEELNFGEITAQTGRPSYNNVKGFTNENPYKKNKPSITMPVSASASIDFKEGDLVQHKKFGMGQVKKIEPGGADYQVTVNFPSIGMKKLLASLSGLKKI